VATELVERSSATSEAKSGVALPDIGSPVDDNFLLISNRINECHNESKIRNTSRCCKKEKKMKGGNDRGSASNVEYIIDLERGGERG